MRRTGQFAEFVTTALEHYDLAGRRLVAVGFSNGANIAAALTLLYPDVLREAALFAAMSPLPDPPAHDPTGTRVFLSNGERDPMAPLPSTEKLVAELEKRSAEVRTHRHPGGHQITLDGVAEAKAWLAAR